MIVAGQRARKSQSPNRSAHHGRRPARSADSAAARTLAPNSRRALSATILDLVEGDQGRALDIFPRQGRSSQTSLKRNGLKASVSTETASLAAGCIPIRLRVEFHQLAEQHYPEDEQSHPAADEGPDHLRLRASRHAWSICPDQKRKAATDEQEEGEAQGDDAQDRGHGHGSQHQPAAEPGPAHERQDAPPRSPAAPRPGRNTQRGRAGRTGQPWPSTPSTHSV